MTNSQKAPKKIRVWQGISWTGLSAFASGYLVTSHILYDLLALEASKYLDLLPSLWTYPFVLLTWRKQRRLAGISSASGEQRLPGRPATRWQALAERINAWPDSMQALAALLMVLGFLLLSYSAMDLLWPGHPEALEIAVLLPLFALSAILLWRKRRRAGRAA